MNDTVTKLMALRERLSDPAKWWKGTRGDDGAPSKSDDSRLCLQRGAQRCGMSLKEWGPLLEAIHRLFPDRGINGRSWLHVFNCHPDTTHADVLMVIDAAIAAAGGEVPMEHPEFTNRKEVAVV